MNPRPRSYWVGLAVATDQWFNALFGGNPDETMSSSIRASAMTGTWSGKVAEQIVNALAFALTFAFTLGRAPQRDHCAKSYERSVDEGLRPASDARQGQLPLLP